MTGIFLSQMQAHFIQNLIDIQPYFFYFFPAFGLFLVMIGGVLFKLWFWRMGSGGMLQSSSWKSKNAGIEKSPHKRPLKGYSLPMPRSARVVITNQPHHIIQRVHNPQVVSVQWQVFREGQMACYWQDMSFCSVRIPLFVLASVSCNNTTSIWVKIFMHSIGFQFITA